MWGGGREERERGREIIVKGAIHVVFPLSPRAACCHRDALFSHTGTSSESKCQSKLKETKPSELCATGLAVSIETLACVLYGGGAGGAGGAGGSGGGGAGEGGACDAATATQRLLAVRTVPSCGGIRRGRRMGTWVRLDWRRALNAQRALDARRSLDSIKFATRPAFLRRSPLRHRGLVQHEYVRLHCR